MLGQSRYLTFLRRSHWRSPGVTKLAADPGASGFTVCPGPCKLVDGRFSLASAVVNYTAAAVSDRGRKRPSNEDAFGYSVEHGVYVVCDGMGGAAAGEIASSLAVDEVLSRLSSGAGDEAAPLEQAPKEVVEQAICAANEAL